MQVGCGDTHILSNTKKTIDGYNWSHSPPENCAKWKKPAQTRMVYVSTYIKFWKWQDSRNEEQIGGRQGPEEVREKVYVTLKQQKKGSTVHCD